MDQNVAIIPVYKTRTKKKMEQILVFLKDFFSRTDSTKPVWGRDMGWQSRRTLVSLLVLMNHILVNHSPMNHKPGSLLLTSNSTWLLFPAPSVPFPSSLAEWFYHS